MWGGPFFLPLDFYDLRPDGGNELFRGPTAKVSGSVSVCVHFFFPLVFTKHKGSVSSCTRSRLPSFFHCPLCSSAGPIFCCGNGQKTRRNCSEVPGFFVLNSLKLSKVVSSSCLSSISSPAIGYFYTSATDKTIHIQELLLYLNIGIQLFIFKDEQPLFSNRLCVYIKF